MAYFSAKSTWLSLVDGAGNPGAEARKPESATPLDGLALSFEDFRPCFPAEGQGIGSDSTATKDGVTDSAEDLDYLRITLELRHRLFFHFKEWEFGPALLEDHLRLAQAQTDPEEALAHYCQARHVSVTLVDKHDQPSYRLAWIEADRVIAEIHDLIGNVESCAVYAKEGLEAIKRGKFPSSLDMRITKLTVRFLNLLGRA
ncbi:MAG: hypothetical protein JWO30_3411 [Fibrobacteres bacterium]|nr:hypothetical protein [Fibrobacterota bacterium]